MANVECTGGQLIVTIEGLDKFWAFKSEVRVPLEHVLSVAPAVEAARSWFHGLRVMGTNMPGFITAGSFYSGDGHVFWDVHDPAQAIAIQLHDEKYDKLVIGVKDPTATIAAIEAAIAG